jgi:Astacin (Peptidase family M12A)
MTKRPLVLVFTAITLALLTNRGSAQSKDPHLPPANPQLALNELVRVDDMLLWPDQLALLTAPPTSRKEGMIYGLNLPYGYWDWGVIPYEIAPNFQPNDRVALLAAMQTWMRIAPITFVPRTTQSGFLAITHDETQNPSEPSPCFGSLGQIGRGRPGRLNLGTGCVFSRIMLHEMGHIVGLFHEHQRPDRDNFVTVDTSNVQPNALGALSKITGAVNASGYDLGSIMHYDAYAFAIDRTRPTIIPRDPSLLSRIGVGTEPSETDHNVVALLYNSQLHESSLRAPTEASRIRFDRADMLTAMERLHAFYMSRLGLNRPQGLSIGGKPDFLGIAQWIFDIYLPARSGGFSTEGAFDIVVAAITRTDEWRQKNPGRVSLTPASFRAAVSLNRDEFLDVLNHLDRFYAAPEGLQRPNGLSIAGGPDFLGIATWIFDIYLSERLNGISPNGAWTITENAIRSTDEWRSKH